MVTEKIKNYLLFYLMVKKQKFTSIVVLSCIIVLSIFVFLLFFTTIAERPLVDRIHVESVRYDIQEIFAQDRENSTIFVVSIINLENRTMPPGDWNFELRIRGTKLCEGAYSMTSFLRGGASANLSFDCPVLPSITYNVTLSITSPQGRTNSISISSLKISPNLTKIYDSKKGL